jgi:hypothetical protein
MTQNGSQGISPFLLEIALTRDGGLIDGSLHKRVAATCSPTFIVVAFYPSMTPIDLRFYFQAITHSHGCCKQRMEREMEEKDARWVKRSRESEMAIFDMRKKKFPSFLSPED